jgi:hypothetical protein
MELPVIELTIDDIDLDRVEMIALVDTPAIMRNWMAFNDQFLQPSQGESQDDFMGRCIPYVMDEGKSQEEAVAICMSKYESMASDKISFDFDDTLSTSEGQSKAKQYIDAGADVYIISARDSKDGMYDVADSLGIDHSHIYATGSNSAKVEKVIELGITKHIDNNADVIAELGSIGEKFRFFKFSAVDKEKRIIAGALMIPDFNIFRVKDDKQFFVRFSRETIEAIVNKFMKEGRVSAFNYMHDENTPLSDIYIQQSFIIDSAKGINTPEGMETLPDGTWFGYIKVDNDEIWNDFVKTGKLKGFSVEGNFSQKEKFNSNIMTKIETMLERLEKRFFSSEEAKKEFGSAKLTDGTEITWEGELTEGTPIMLADGSPAPDGDHTLEDGSIVSIVGGIVTAIAKPEEAPSMEDMSAEMKSEIEALKLSVAELKSAIESNKPQDFSSDIASLKETQKELFETIKAFNESKDTSSKANNFKKAEVKISNKIDAMAERFAREGNLN